MRRFGLTVALLGLVVAPLARADHPGTRIGVEPDTITIGIHVSATGASPVRVQAFDAGARLYWTWLHDDQGRLVNGRRVEAVIFDDEGSRGGGAAACDALSAESFLLVGFLGSEAIGGCGGFAAERGVPYLAPGTVGTLGEGSTFALSTTPTQESPIVASFVTEVLGETVDRYGQVPYVLPVLEIELPLLTMEGPDDDVRIGLVRPNMPSWDDVEDALRGQLEARGETLDAVYAVVNEGLPSEAPGLLRQARSDGIDVLVTGTSGLMTAALLNQARNDEYFPHFVLFSMTGGFDPVLGVACPETGTVTAFSAWPAWSDAGGFDADFVAAADAHEPDLNVAGTGDTVLAAWALMKNVHQLLEAAGPDPTREDLLGLMEAGYTHATGLFGDVTFGPGDHLGGSSVHRLAADCEAKLFREADAFVTSYD